jgi:hypothetical protein
VANGAPTPDHTTLYVVGGATAVALAGGVVTFFLWNHYDGALHDKPASRAEATSDLNNAQLYGPVSIACFAAGAVGAAVTGWLYLRQPSQPDQGDEARQAQQTEVTAAWIPGGGGLTVTGVWGGP